MRAQRQRVAEKRQGPERGARAYRSGKDQGSAPHPPERLQAGRRAGIMAKPAPLRTDLGNHGWPKGTVYAGGGWRTREAQPRRETNER